MTATAEGIAVLLEEQQSAKAEHKGIGVLQIPSDKNSFLASASSGGPVPICFDH